MTLGKLLRLSESVASSMGMILTTTHVFFMGIKQNDSWENATWTRFMIVGCAEGNVSSECSEGLFTHALGSVLHTQVSRYEKTLNFDCLPSSPQRQMSEADGDVSVLISPKHSGFYVSQCLKGWNFNLCSATPSPILEMDLKSHF